MQVIIDRFESEYAIVEIELGVFAKISKTLVPEAKEGDSIIISIDKNSTINNQKKITKLMDNLFE